MNYYIDCEFLEGTQKERFPISLFRKNTPPTIDLISIAIVEEDKDAFSKRIGVTDRTYRGREYYAVSKDFNLKEAWNRWQPRKGQGDRNNTEPKEYWIRENVLRPIFEELTFKDYMSNEQESVKEFTSIIVETEVPLQFFKEEFLYKMKVWYWEFNYKNLKSLIERYGKTNKQIAEEIKEFVYTEHFKRKSNGDVLDYKDGNPIQFYGYYSAYDHVALCWLFGKMIDLPNGFPMYCRDLKQMLDEKVDKITNSEMKQHFGYPENANIKEPTFEEKLQFIKMNPKYPQQTNNHNALSDAIFNKQLHEFIKSL